MKNYLIAIDQGTTGTTAILVDAKDFTFVDKINQEFPQIFPQPGWVEHDLNDIWNTVELTVSKLVKKHKLTKENICSIGITNQRETTCAFDKNGMPLANAIVWQDRRTADYCNNLKPQEEQIKKSTGLPIDPYFSGTKMNWLLANNSNVTKAADNNSLRFGTVDTFLLYRLTNGNSFATEPSNASRTLLMDLKKCNWGPELCDLFGVSTEFLPEIKDSFGNFGETSGTSFLPDGIPITGILGDQQAALFGQAGLEKGGLKCTYGTGAFLLLNTGTEVQYSNAGLLSTVAYRYDNKTYYALEGSCYIAGAAVQWLRDNLNIIESSPEVEKLANEVKDLKQMEHLLFLPFFTGIGSPYWDPSVKAAIIGMTRDTGKQHLAKACLDGIALSINDLIEAMKKDSGLAISQLNVDGGAVANDLLMNTQANVSQLKIVRPEIIETTSYGAALGAAIGANILKMDRVHTFWKENKVFESSNDQVSFYETKKRQWNSMIKKLMD